MTSTVEATTGKEQSIIEGKRKILPGLIDNAFNLGGGIGSHSIALLKLTTRRELNDRDKGTLEQMGSNYLNNPYTIDWRQGRTGFMTRLGPHKTSPFSDDHLELFAEADRAYIKTTVASLRVILNGQALEQEALIAPVTDSELIELFSKGDRMGIVEFDPSKFDHLEISSKDFGLAAKLKANGVVAGDEFFDALSSQKFSERLKMLTLEAATLKLATMLALLHQLTYDARALGIPIKADYKPAPLDKWQPEWERNFERPLPDISTLYKYAHFALITNASYGGLHAQHLLLLPKLIYLNPD